MWNWNVKVKKGQSILDEVSDRLIREGNLDESDRLIEIYDEDEHGYFDTMVLAQEDCICYVTQDKNTGEFGISVRTTEGTKVSW